MSELSEGRIVQVTGWHKKKLNGQCGTVLSNDGIALEVNMWHGGVKSFPLCNVLDVTELNQSFSPLPRSATCETASGASFLRLMRDCAQDMEDAEQFAAPLAPLLKPANEPEVALLDVAESWRLRLHARYARAVELLPDIELANARFACCGGDDQHELWQQWQRLPGVTDPDGMIGVALFDLNGQVEHAFVRLNRDHDGEEDTEQCASVADISLFARDPSRRTNPTPTTTVLTEPTATSSSATCSGGPPPSPEEEPSFDCFFAGLIDAGIISETQLDKLTDVLARGEHDEATLMRGWRREKLLHAAKHGEVRVAAGLLAARASAAEVCPQSGYTPLVMAVAERQEAVADLLLAQRADPAQGTTDGCTPLIMLAERPDDVPSGEWRDVAGARLARRLLEVCSGSSNPAGGGSDDRSPCRLLSQRDCNGLTALTAAVFHGNVSLVEALLACGASSNEPTADGDATTPLMLCLAGEAEATDQRPLVEMLLAARARANATDAFGHTALTYAMGSGRRDITRLLQEVDDEGGEEEDAGLLGPDGMPLDVTERLITSLCLQREQENARIGRVETEDELFRAVVNSPYFKATLEAKGELRADHDHFTSRFWPTAEEGDAS
jgi:ankyrin repeat protein